MKSIIGRKMGMTEVFAADGTMYPVTVIEVLPNVVIGKKTIEKDGYEAIQVGYEDKRAKSVNKPEAGEFKKAGVTPKEGIYELKGDEIYSKQVGESLDASLFASGELVDIIGKHKGHGFSGVIKRYHHTIGPKGHGSGYHRGIGSMANNGRTNNRVIPGKKMPGQWRPAYATILNVSIVESNPEKGYILVKGGVPGAKKSIVMLRSPVRSNKKLPEIKPLVDLNAKAEEAVVEETIAKEPVVEEVIVETPVVEEVVVETAPVEEAAVTETPTAEEPAAEVTSEETPVAEEAPAEEKGE